MSEMTNMIADSAQRLFSDNVTKKQLESFESGTFQKELWNLASDSGFPLVAVPEAAGGVGGEWIDAYPVLRGVGYWQVPLPLAETVVAASLLARAGIAVPDGPISLVENGYQAELKIDGKTISGTAHAVPWARTGDWLLVSSNGMLHLVSLRSEGKVTITEKANAAAEPRDTVVFANAPVAASAKSTLGDEPVRVFGALAKAASMLGALECVLDLGVRYANERVQFGRPLAKHQAIQHALAILAGEVASVRMAVRVAFEDASKAGGRAESTRFDAAVAKVRASEAAGTAASIVHQVHGAIGFTYEHMLHFATRRLWSWRGENGSDAVWAAELGRAAIEAGGAGFWPGLTARTLIKP